MISDKERALISQRQALVLKHYKSGLSDEERMSLNELEARINEIESQQVDLSRLERMVAVSEKLVATIDIILKATLKARLKSGEVRFR